MKMKSIKFVVAAIAFTVSAHASACLLCDFLPSKVSEDTTLSYGTVVSLEPVDMSQVDYTLINDHQMATAGAALSGGSLSGAIIGGVVGAVTDAVVHKATKVIDGYVVTIALDSGEKMVVTRPKNEVKSRSFDTVDKRVAVEVSPKRTYITGSFVTKEEAPAMIAKRAPHQVKKPAEVAPDAKPAEQKAEVQPSITNAEEAKTASAN
jgi:outer membrane lipoprotein SlyB